MPLSTFFNLPEDKRQKILNCAIDEFAQNDYKNASITKIVAKTGISKGSLYQYFIDKQDLHHYLLQLAAQKKAEMFSEFQASDPNMSVFETLRALFQVMVTFELKEPKLAKIGSRALNGDVPLPEGIMKTAKESTQSYICVLIEMGKQRGEIRPDVDAYITSYFFSSALTGMSEYLKSRNFYGLSENENDMEGLSRFKTVRIEKAFDQIISIFQNGIANIDKEKGETNDK